MQVALIGLPGAGVKTVFSAITELGAPGDGSPESFGAHRIVVLQVPDPRLDLIAEVFQPRKTVPAAIEIIEFPGLFGGGPEPATPRCGGPQNSAGIHPPGCPVP